MRLNTDGLIIKEQAVGESDKLVTVLTADLGVIRAFVKRGRSIKSRMGASTGLLCYSHLTVFNNKGTYYIDEATAAEVFFGLRSDIARTALAQYFCDVCMHIGVEESSTPEVLRLMLNCLYFLADGKRTPEQIKPVLELRLMAYSGFSPDLTACCECGATDGEMLFDVRGGVLICGGCCGGNTVGRMRISAGVAAAMRHIAYCDFSKLFSFTLSDEGLKRLGEVTEQYLAVQTDRRFKTLDFYKSLL